MVCAWVQFSACMHQRLMDFWPQMFYQDNPPCSNLQRRLCGSIKSQFALLKWLNTLFHNSSEPSPSRGQQRLSPSLPCFSKPAIKKQRKCHDFGAVRKLLSRSAGYFSLCHTEKSGQTQWINNPIVLTNVQQSFKMRWGTKIGDSQAA